MRHGSQSGEFDLSLAWLQSARAGSIECPAKGHVCVAKEGRVGGKGMKWAKFTGPSGNVIWYELETGVTITEATESERGRFGQARTVISRSSTLLVRETLDQVATALGAKNGAVRAAMSEGTHNFQHLYRRKFKRP